MSSSAELLEDIWELEPPSQTRCCLCGKSFKKHNLKIVLEDRPTGLDFAIQSWSWCRGCWRKYGSQKYLDDHVLAKLWKDVL